MKWLLFVILALHLCTRVQHATLYVRKRGCDYGDCSSDTFSSCANNTATNAPSSTSTDTLSAPDVCTSDIIEISSSSIFTNSLFDDVSSGDGTMTLCYEMKQNVECYHPLISVQFEAIDYLPFGKTFNIGYQNQSNLLNSDDCKTNVQRACSVFNDCDIDTNEYIGDPGDGPWTWINSEDVYDKYKVFYFMNSNSVRPDCQNPTRSISVIISIDCSAEVASSSCNSLNYTWLCFNGIESECGQYDGNGTINIGDGAFDLFHPIIIDSNDAHQHIIFEGNGSQNTILNHVTDNDIDESLIQCGSQCLVSFINMTYATNTHMIQVNNGGNLTFDNVVFNFESNPFSFVIQGSESMILFKNCHFHDHIKNNPLFSVSDHAMVHFYMCSFVNNTLLNDDGLFSIHGSTLSIEDSEFIANRGENTAVNFMLFSDDNSTISIMNSIFQNNEYFNALIQQNASSRALSITSCSFDANSDVNYLVQGLDLISSVFYILDTAISEDNECLSGYCLSFLNSNLYLDEFAIYPTNAPTISPTTAPTITPSAAPTTAPTSSPTDTTLVPSSQPTTEPTLESQNPNAIFMDFEIYPETQTVFDLRIQLNGSLEYEQHLVYIEVIPIDEDCLYPSVSFITEEIDFSNPDTEYMNIYEDGNLISHCTGSADKNCANFVSCLDDYTLSESIVVNETRLFMIYEPAQVNALCTNHSYSTNGIFTIKCNNKSSAPTSYPTASPIISYALDIHPQKHNNSTFDLEIQNEDDEKETYFNIYVTSMDNDCFYPTVTLIVEETDFSYESTEYVQLYDDNDTLIAHCTGSKDSNCDEWLSCVEDYDLGIDKIAKGDTKVFTLYESERIDSNQHSCNHSFSINAIFSIQCSDSNISYAYTTTALTATESTFYTTTPAPTSITSSPSMHPTYSYRVQFGHSSYSAAWSTLYLEEFGASQLSEFVDFIHFGKDNGSVVYAPCDTFDSASINSTHIIFDSIQNSSAHYIECVDTLCTADSISSNNVSNVSLIECSTSSSCLKTKINVAHTTQAAIKCIEARACEQAELHINKVDTFSLECMLADSCTDLILNVSNYNDAQIRCYGSHSCDYLSIFSDSDDIQLFIYNYNEGIHVNVPSAFVKSNLNCNPMNAYVNMNGTQSMDIEEASQMIFGGSMPCDGIQYTFDDGQKAECDIQYEFDTDTLYINELQFLEEYITCFVPIEINEFTDFECIGTWSPSNAPSNAPTFNPSVSPSDSPTDAPSNAPSSPPTNAPSTSPTFSPTRTPTIYHEWNKWIYIQYGLRYFDETNYAQLTDEDSMLSALSTIQSILEYAFVNEAKKFGTIMEYQSFQVVVESINGHEIDKLRTSGNINTYKSSLVATIDTITYIDEYAIGSTILVSLRTSGFRNTSQDLLRDYFENDALELVINPNNNDLSILTEGEEEELDIFLWSMVAFVCVFSGIAAVALLANMLRYVTDDSRWWLLISYSLQVFDFASDINLTLEITLLILSDWDLHKHNIKLLIAGAGSVVFVLVPYISNLFIVIRIKTWLNNDAAKLYFEEKTTIFITLCTISGSAYASLSLLSSNIFGLDAFNSGLTDWEIRKLQKLKIAACVFAENIPQIICQFIYVLAVNGATENTYLSFIASTISVIGAIISYLINKESPNTATIDYTLNVAKHSYDGVSAPLTAIERRIVLKKKALTKALRLSLTTACGVAHKSIEFGNSTLNHDGLSYHMIQHFIQKQNDINAAIKVQQIFDTKIQQINKTFSDHFDGLHVLVSISITNDDTLAMVYQYVENYLTLHRQDTMIDKFKHLFRRTSMSKITRNQTDSNNIIARNDSIIESSKRSSTIIEPIKFAPDMEQIIELQQVTAIVTSSHKHENARDQHHHEHHNRNQSEEFLEELMDDIEHLSMESDSAS